MGKHAQTRQPSRARRVAVVSTGTLLLCLCGAAPALADIGPVPVPQPVDDAVTTVTDIVGVPNPLHAKDPADSAKPAKHAKHKHHASARLTSSTLTTQPSTRPASRTTTLRVRHTPAPAPASYPLGGLRAVPMTTTAPMVDVGRAPVTAGAVPADGQVLAASSAPRLVTPSADVLDGTGGEEGPRVLIVGLAAMVLGGLSAGHIKVAQDRIAQLIG